MDVLQNIQKFRVRAGIEVLQNSRKFRVGMKMVVYPYPGYCGTGAAYRSSGYRGMNIVQNSTKFRVRVWKSYAQNLQKLRYG